MWVISSSSLLSRLRCKSLHGARKRGRSWRQKNIKFQRVICMVKVKIKIKQKLYEKQSIRQGWHSCSCHRGCCTDSYHFSVWVVFLSHRMEPLLVAAVSHDQTKGSMRVQATESQFYEEWGLTWEDCAKHLLHATAEESVLQEMCIMNYDIMYFSIFYHLTLNRCNSSVFKK